MSKEEVWLRIFEAITPQYSNNQIRILVANEAYEAYLKKMGIK